eukprot:3110002-Prymnesium_polylepis.1
MARTVWTVTRLTCHPSPTDLRLYLCAEGAVAHQAPRPVKKASTRYSQKQTKKSPKGHAD